MSTLFKIAIVGFGKVGRVMARAFKAKGFDIAGIVARAPFESLEFNLVPAIADLPADVDFLLLCVRDGQIEEVAKDIIEWRIRFPPRLRGGARGGVSSVADPAQSGEGKPGCQSSAVDSASESAIDYDESTAGSLSVACLDSRLHENDAPHAHLIVAHTAGAISAEVLAPLREVNTAVMAWHPLQTFTGDEGAELLEGVTFGIDGDDEAVSVGEALALKLDGKPLRIETDKRALYHLGAVFACNFLAALAGISLDLLKKAGIDERRALEALSPLLTATVGNIARKGLPDAITGPVRRGDVETIQKHLALLKPYPEVEKLYRELNAELTKRLGNTYYLKDK
ncbi:MAG: DUF2520 domain-containing protein [Calditrichaeota bacterium]|nr:DUF2520 domain-containing protein [Calditrichota bacterium]